MEYIQGNQWNKIKNFYVLVRFLIEEDGKVVGFYRRTNKSHLPLKVYHRLTKNETANLKGRYAYYYGLSHLEKIGNTIWYCLKEESNGRRQNKRSRFKGDQPNGTEFIRDDGKSRSNHDRH